MHAHQRPVRLTKPPGKEKKGIETKWVEEKSLGGAGAGVECGGGGGALNEEPWHRLVY